MESIGVTDYFFSGKTQITTGRTENYLVEVEYMIDNPDRIHGVIFVKVWINAEDMDDVDYEQYKKALKERRIPDLGFDY
jgi:hypothetical protein